LLSEGFKQALDNTQLVAGVSLRLQLTLRKEGQVAGLESPNALSATGKFQAGQARSSK